MSFQLIREMWNIRRQRAEESHAQAQRGPRCDDGAPLNIRIGSIATVNPVAGVLAGAVKHKIGTVPSELTVTAYGKINAGGSLGAVLHRFYAGDDYVLQVEQEVGYGGTPSIHLYRALRDEELPVNPNTGQRWGKPVEMDEWNDWIQMYDEKRPNEAFIVGYLTFQMPTHDEVYGRAWQSGGPPQVDPVCVTEWLYADPWASPMRYDRKLMLYDRLLPDAVNKTETSEQVLVSTIQSVVGGSTSQAWVELSYGLEVAAGDLTVLTK